MNTQMKWLLAVAVVVAAVAGADDAMAQSTTFTSNGIGGGSSVGGAGSLFVDAEKLGDNTVGRTQQVVYGLGGLGAIGLGALAFFGRFQWSWFFGLVGGLAMIAGLQTGIEYFTGDSSAVTQTKNTAN